MMTYNPWYNSIQGYPPPYRVYYPLHLYPVYPACTPLTSQPGMERTSVSQNHPPTNPSDSKKHRRLNKSKRSVIVEFNQPSLLDKIGKIPNSQITAHPYRQQLRSQIQNAFNQIKARFPDVQLRHIFDTVFSGMALRIDPEIRDKLKQFHFIKDIYEDRRMKRRKRCVSDVVGPDQNQLNLELINSYSGCS